MSNCIQAVQNQHNLSARKLDQRHDQLYFESVNAKCWCYAKIHPEFEAEDVARHYNLPIEDVRTSLLWLAERGIIPQPTIEKVV